MNNRVQFYINKAISALLIFLMIGMSSIIVLQVFFRYVLNAPLPWPEEIARIAIVWLTFYGCYLAMYEKRHVGFDLFLNKMHDKKKNTILIIQSIFNGFFIMVIIIYGFKFTMDFASIKLSYSQVPMGVVYSVFPISGILMMYQTILDLIDQIKVIRR